MPALLAELFPLLYGLCFLALLWQAFRVMGRGFRAAAAPPTRSGSQAGGGSADRTGRLTIHPELIDADGQLTREDLLTVRFGADSDSATPPADPA
ncbi:MAG: DUF2973 domain-containing protein [Vulcanococcus sp.]